MNRPLLVPAALIGLAGMVAAVGVGSHDNQRVVVAGDSLTAQADAQINLVVTADGRQPIVQGVSGSSITNRNAVFDWSTRITELAAKGTQLLAEKFPRSSLPKKVLNVGARRNPLALWSHGHTVFPYRMARALAGQDPDQRPRTGQRCAAESHSTFTQPRSSRSGTPLPWSSRMAHRRRCPLQRSRVDGAGDLHACRDRRPAIT